MPTKDGSSGWRGSSIDLDWDIACCRSRLREFAGMTEEEITNV
jgi:hypothetical protein